MASKDVAEIIRMYNALIQNAANSSNSKISKRAAVLIGYASKYNKKDITSGEFKTISMILQDLKRMTQDYGKGKRSRKSVKTLQAATATVTVQHDTRSAVQPVSRPTLGERARERAGLGEKTYRTVDRISKLTVELAPNSVERFNEINVALTKRLAGIEVDDRGQVQDKNGNVTVRIRDDTGEIKVLVNLEALGISIEDLTNMAKGKVVVDIKGTLKEDPTWKFTVIPYIKADSISVSKARIN